MYHNVIILLLVVVVPVIKNEQLCNNICRKQGKYYERDNTGNRYIKAFQLFKILILLLLVVVHCHYH